MAEGKDPFSLLCEKLQSPHPVLQRIAVSSIFQKLGQKPGTFQSLSGKEALNRCITSRSPCIVDQSVRELCTLAKSGLISYAHAMQILQAALDSVTDSSTSITVLVGGIGFICRLHVASSDSSHTTFSIHPLLKALLSRQEAGPAILNQVRLILLHSGDGPQRERAISFIQPFLAHVFLEPSQVAFAREFHVTMCMIADTLGPSTIELLLLRYIECRPLKSPQDLEFLSEAVLLLTEVLEEFPEATETVDRLTNAVFCLWREGRSCSLSSLPFVSLVRRLSSLSRRHSDVHLASLACFLATAELEQEQLQILALANSWLQDKSLVFSLQSLLLWIFPTLHILASPSISLKNAATSLLFEIEHLLTGKSFSTVKASQSTTLEGRVFELLVRLWSEDQRESCASSAESPTVEWLRKVKRSEADGFPMVLAMIATALIFHPVAKVAMAAAALLAKIGRDISVWGISLVPVVLYTLKFHLQKGLHPQVVIALLNALPDLCAHSTALPLSMHFLQPMVEYTGNMTIQSTAVRLICKIWKHTDRAFPYLQSSLVHGKFPRVGSETELLLAKAVSLREVCNHDPDAGVDLILSVQACIESKLPIVQSLGLESLSSLCGDDAIDFYTAWKVIGSYFEPLPQVPAVAESLCMLLKNGAFDAAAKPEEAVAVVRILWRFSLQLELSDRIRATALHSLCAYEVELLKETMSDKEHLEVLLTEANTVARPHAQRLITMFLQYEHRTRQRATNDKIAVTKLGKLLESVPLTFPKDDPSGASLFLWRSSREQISSTSSRKAVLKDDAEEIKRHFFHAAENLNASGDLIMAFIAAHSWSWFMPQWLKQETRLHEGEIAVENIVNICISAADEGSPRVAENATLALAAFSQLFSQAGFNRSEVLAKHFDSGINNSEHEFTQWSAAISLGIFVTFLHPTDWPLKAKSIGNLTKLVNESETGILLGSAAVGLGLASQTLLLTKSSSFDSEYRLLSDILHHILHKLTRRCRASASAIESLGFLDSEGFNEAGKDRGEFWDVVGLVWALGASVTALSRAGNVDLVNRITQTIIAWLPESIDDTTDMSLAAGACLVIPTCVEVADRLELLESGSLERLLDRFGALIRQVIDLPQSKRSSSLWLVHVFRAMCIGCGGLLAAVLQTGRHPLSFNSVKDILEMFQRGYVELEHAEYSFCSMLGFANALGAAITSTGPASTFVQTEQVGNKLTSPLLFSSMSEEIVRTMLQKLVNISHTSPDNWVKSYGKWCLGIMHAAWLRMRESPVDDRDKAVRWSYRPAQLSSLPKNSTLRGLCEWLVAAQVGVPCSKAVAVMQCLEDAPRLPMLDWGGLLRRLMQQKEWFIEDSFSHADVRKQCLVLSLRHASQVPPLATVLDEVYELPRLCSADRELQKFLLSRLGYLQKIFSPSRNAQLFEDVFLLLERITDQEHARECRVHCWNGLERFWETETEQSLDLVEACARKLVVLSYVGNELSREDEKEWSAALSCLKHARRDWLLEVFSVSTDDIVRAAFARCRLVSSKVLPVLALIPVRSWLLDQKLTGQWMLLTELAIAVNDAPFEEKLDWLLVSVDTAYVSKYPSTAVHFVALLANMWSPHSYLFPTDRSSLEYLPHSLQALVSQEKWSRSGGVITTKIFTLAERISTCSKEKSVGETSEELSCACEVVEKTAISLRRFASAEMIVKLID